MIENIKDNYNLQQNKIALTINRYRKQGYTIVGVGYPFFYYEYLGLINLCEFFVDDETLLETIGWSKRFTIKDLSKLNSENKYVVICFSLNRCSTLKKIKKFVKDIKIIELYKDIEIVQTYSDIELSQKLLFRSSMAENINVLNAVSIKGDCEIINSSNKPLNISYLEMCKNSFFKNSSRHNNNYDTFYLSPNSSYNIRLDGQAHIRNCFLNDNSKIDIFSGQLNIEDTYIGENCKIHVYDNVSIGSGTIISWNVSIMDGDGHAIMYDDKNNRPCPINIQEKVWIGNNATVLKGVTIGEGSVIAAGSVVTHSIPPHSLAAGNPAKVIKSDVKWNYKYSF